MKLYVDLKFEICPYQHYLFVPYCFQNSLCKYKSEITGIIFPKNASYNMIGEENAVFSRIYLVRPYETFSV